MFNYPFFLRFLNLLAQALPLRIRRFIRNSRDLIFRKFIHKELKHADSRCDLGQKNKPLVSVVIPCFNYGRYMEEAVDSILAQTWQDIEIIVVDDGSDDLHTLHILDCLKKPKTRILRQKNGKPSSARNAGIHMSQGKYICCMDADDKLSPTYLEKCLLRLESGDVDICGSWQQDFGDSQLIQIPGPFSLKRLLHENCLIVASVFRKDMWEYVGGYDETMVDGYEDWEFWIRLAGVGARASTIQEPLFWYRKHGKSMMDKARQNHEHIVKHIRVMHRRLLRNPAKVFCIDVLNNL